METYILVGDGNVVLLVGNNLNKMLISLVEKNAGNPKTVAVFSASLQSMKDESDCVYLYNVFNDYVCGGNDRIITCYRCPSIDKIFGL